MIAQLYLVYYGAGEIHGLLERAHLWWFFREPLNCVMFTFVLNTSAYQARIIHGAVVNLPRELTDAALALALPRHVTLFRILLPQALLTALGRLGNEATKMIKASAVASLVTVLDLLGTARTCSRKPSTSTSTSWPRWSMCCCWRHPPLVLERLRVIWRHR